MTDRGGYWKNSTHYNPSQIDYLSLWKINYKFSTLNIARKFGLEINIGL